MQSKAFAVGRRRALKFVAGVVTGLALAPAALLRSRAAQAAWADLDDKAVPPVQDFPASVKRMFGDREIAYREGAIDFIVPNVAENGAVVPVQADLVEALPAGRYVKSIYIIVEKNKRPLAVTYDFTEATGIGHAAAYLRMGQTSWIHAVYEYDDGSLLATKKQTKVVVGGCGG